MPVKLDKLPIYFGYAGALPFVLFMLITLLLNEPKHVQLLSFLQLSYGAMILSFLGGIHWGQALPSGNNKQLSFSMVPTVTCLGLMIWTFAVDPVLPLFAMAALFWIVFKADQKYMPKDFISAEYFTFRKRLTMIVVSTLIISGLVSL
ncbi:MAG: DUF3429 domain-containing protein [Pseudomonadota bacterium]